MPKPTNLLLINRPAMLALGQDGPLEWLWLSTFRVTNISQTNSAFPGALKVRNVAGNGYVDLPDECMESSFSRVTPAWAEFDLATSDTGFLELTKPGGIRASEFLDGPRARVWRSSWGHLQPFAPAAPMREAVLKLLEKPHTFDEAVDALQMDRTTLKGQIDFLSPSAIVSGAIRLYFDPAREVLIYQRRDRQAPSHYLAVPSNLPLRDFDPVMAACAVHLASLMGKGTGTRQAAAQSILNANQVRETMTWMKKMGVELGGLYTSKLTVDNAAFLLMQIREHPRKSAAGKAPTP